MKTLILLLSNNQILLYDLHNYINKGISNIKIYIARTCVICIFTHNFEINEIIGKFFFIEDLYVIEE